jgi:hypothetical protein
MGVRLWYVSYVDVDKPVPVLGSGKGGVIVLGLESAAEPAAVQLALHLHNHRGTAFLGVRVSSINPSWLLFLRHLLFIINKVQAPNPSSVKS